MSGLEPFIAEHSSNTACDNNFDYTEWQRGLWEDKTLDEVFELAAKREKARQE